MGSLTSGPDAASPRHDREIDHEETSGEERSGRDPHAVSWGVDGVGSPVFRL